MQRCLSIVPQSCSKYSAVAVVHPGVKNPGVSVAYFLAFGDSNPVVLRLQLCLSGVVGTTDR
jgi:hypothetical protein